MTLRRLEPAFKGQSLIELKDKELMESGTVYCITILIIIIISSSNSSTTISSRSDTINVRITIKCGL